MSSGGINRIKSSSAVYKKQNEVVTTNDNIGAIAFYQKIGFDMVQIYHDSMDYVRKFKPGVPMMGENHIPLRHEIEFSMHL